MHSKEPNKDNGLFRQEVDAILNGISKDHRPKDKFDMIGFVFLEGNYSGITFTKAAYFNAATFTEAAYFNAATFTEAANFEAATFTQFVNFEAATFTEAADFKWATFTQFVNFEAATFTEAADFKWATFTQFVNFEVATFTEGANFDLAIFSEAANFSRATFTQAANFEEATFTGDANFEGTTFTQAVSFELATFTQAAYFVETIFAKTADFRNVNFQEPAAVRFISVNQSITKGINQQEEQDRNESDRQTLRIRFLNCQMEGVTFEDVNWHYERDRVVLEDELDLKTKKGSYELVAVAYRRLVNNFERTRNYDLAEDCFIGAMEMKRIDRNQPLFVRAVLNVYRWASLYGSSYRRAVGVLFLLIFFFGLAFAIPWVQLDASSEPNTLIRASEHFLGGLIHSWEVATFQRRALYSPTSHFSQLVAGLETALVPGQLALLLLSLRRRFRR